MSLYRFWKAVDAYSPMKTTSLFFSFCVNEIYQVQTNFLAGHYKLNFNLLLVTWVPIGNSQFQGGTKQYHL